MVQDIKRKLDSKKCVSLVMIDFTSAFNSMCHKRLIEKLRNQFQFSVTASKLILSFINNREQVVRLGDIISESCTQTSGSPQGSSLSALLFCMYVNDLGCVIQHCEKRTYADDLQVYLTSNPEDLASNTILLNQDLKAIEEWSSENHLLPNPKKTKCMLLSKHELSVKPPVVFMHQTLEYCDVARNLGVMLDQRLDWQCQVSAVCKKVHYTLHTLRIFRSELSSELRMLLARAVIMPIFLYADVVYFPSITAEQKLRLELCFKSTLRFVHGLRGRDSTRDIRSTIVGLDLPMYMNLRLAVFVFMAMRGLLPRYISEEFPQGVSQRTMNLAVPRQHSAWIQNSTMVKGIAIWNRLPEDCKRAKTVSTFKKKTKQFLSNVGHNWPFL